MSGRRRSIRLNDTCEGWGVVDTSDNQLDGFVQKLIGGVRFGSPDHLSGYRIMVFKSRAAARAHIEKHYGYMRTRPDLKAEPHGWRMPKAMRVRVNVRV